MFLFSWETGRERIGAGIACDSSTGFVLPNGARRSPDASWTLESRVKQLGTGQHNAFWHLCPGFVIEVMSQHDRLNPLREKMREHLAQGAQLGWLINPQDKTVEVFRVGGDGEKHKGIDRLEAEGLVAGFVLDLTYVWNPLAD